MSKIKSIILFVIKLIVVIFILVVINRLFMPKYISENQDGRITQEYYKEKLNTDVLFVGSSTVYSGVSPVTLWKDYGITSYTRSNSSQTLWISYYMIEEAIKRNKPQLVVQDVGFIKYDDNYAEEACTRKSLDGMKWSSSKVNCINESMSEDENFIDYVFPIFRFHSRWKELTEEDYKSVFYTGTVSHNGHLVNKNKSPELVEHDGYAPKDDTRLGNRNLEYLEKIIKLCQENDVQIMLIKVPSYSDNWSYDYDAQIGEVADKYGVVYNNFDDESELIGLDYRNDSPDNGSHLNSYGAEKFSKYFGSYILENYDVDNHASDEKYITVWNKKINDYDKALMD